MNEQSKEGPDVENSYSTLIIENDSLVREGLRLLLEKTKFSPQTCSLETDDDWPDEAPAVLIVFGREKTELAQLVARLREKFSEARIVVLAAESDFQVLSAAMEAGANAILLMSISAEGLIKALEAVVVGNIFVIDSRIWPPGAVSITEAPTRILEDAGAVPASTRGLSVREIEIVKRIVEGDSNKHIARRLDIAEATVKAHVKTLLRKIGVGNRTQAAIWAMNQGFGQEEGGTPFDEKVIEPDLPLTTLGDKHDEAVRLRGASAIGM